MAARSSSPRMRMIGAVCRTTVVGRDNVAGKYHLDPNVEHDPLGRSDDRLATPVAAEKFGRIDIRSEIATLGTYDARPTLVAVNEFFFAALSMMILKTCPSLRRTLGSALAFLSSESSRSMLAP